MCSFTVIFIIVLLCVFAGSIAANYSDETAKHSYNQQGTGIRYVHSDP